MVGLSYVTGASLGGRLGFMDVVGGSLKVGDPEGGDDIVGAVLKVGPSLGA